MATQISFSRFENDLIRHFRRRISDAESSTDVEKFFDYAIRELCTKIFGNNLELKQQDFLFTQEGESLFQIHKRLLSTDAFKKAWDNSDLPNIVERFAQVASHRAIHLEKHREKTNLKIRR